MHEILFGDQLSNQDCLDLGIEQKYINSGIQCQIDFVLIFDLPPNPSHHSFFIDDLKHLFFKNFKNEPQHLFSNFRGQPKYAAILWHD